MTARLTIVGGGVSWPRGPQLLAQRPDIPALAVQVVARRAERLGVIVEHARALLAGVRTDFSVAGTTDLQAGLQGADLVLLMPRIGGLAARAQDERLAVAFAQAPAEGLGLGGAAHAWRPLPAMARFADAILGSAPAATVLNLVAPLGVTTRALLDAGCRAVGLCELPLVTEAKLAAVSLDPLGQDAPDVLHYAGFNHMGWFFGRDAAGAETLQRGVTRGLVDADVLAAMGAAPLHYYYDVFDRRAGQRLRRADKRGRADVLAGIADRAVDYMRRETGVGQGPAAERSTPWFEHAVVPAVAALLGGAPWRGFANVQGVVGTERAGVVAESRATFSSTGVRPDRWPELPAAVARWLCAVELHEDLLYGACRRQSVDGVAEALAALPLGLTPARAAQAAQLMASREAERRASEGSA